MKVLTIHYKKNKNSEYVYYSEHLLTNKEAFMFGGEQFDEGTTLDFESKLCFLHNNKYILAEDEFTNKHITLYMRHELGDYDEETIEE